jgi:periplasmic protein TonB
MPRFPGCEDLEGNNEVKRKCSELKMLDYVYSNLEYPVEAFRNNKEGKVILKVLINKEGIIEYIQILSSPDLSFSKAAEKVVLSMNEMPERWKPGIQRGKVVDVWYQFHITHKTVIVKAEQTPKMADLVAKLFPPH